MCGVAGFVGQASGKKRCQRSYQFMSKLLAETISRGPHATGAYTLAPDPENEGKDLVWAYKLDVGARQFVNTSPWKTVYQQNPYLLLGHCRNYTHGSPQDHVNNHPHLSDDKRLALTHNGIINGYDGLKVTYPCLGECDSEVLLRIIESEGADSVESVLAGIQKVFRVVKTGSFACMLSYYDTVERQSHLFCFRDSVRPMVMVDLRKQLGQYFLASTDEIMKEAMEKSAMPKNILREEIKDVPPDEIWHCEASELEWDIQEVETVAPIIHLPATNINANTWTGSQAVGGVDSDSVKSARTLIDTIIEGITEIDEGLSTGDDFGLDHVALKTALQGIAWEVEQIANPAVSDRTSALGADNEYYD